MASHPRVEEVEDSDVDMSDPSEGDIDDFSEADILRRVDDSAMGITQQSQPLQAPQHHVRPVQSQKYPRQQQLQQQQLRPSQLPTAPSAAAYADFQCLYPVYFDMGRTRAEGRRVSKALAVANPLATEIMRACEALELPTVLEATKLHPKDWANPGRVKVALKRVAATAAGRHLPPVAGAGTVIQNKHHLYVQVARHLQAHPTTEASAALRFRVPGAPPLPEQDKAWPRPAVPRGWKMNELLPHYSPALSGGGVSENLLTDMLKEMQGRGDISSMLMGGMGGAGGNNGSSGGVVGGGGASDEKRKDRKGKGKG